MTLPLAGVIASYLVIAVLLLSLNLASHWHWGIKAAAIAITTSFFGISYFSIAGLIGWPSEARVPEHFQLHWATIVEPDKLNGLAGSIYLWVEALDEANMPAGTPRALRRARANRRARVTPPHLFSTCLRSNSRICRRRRCRQSSRSEYGHR